MCRSSVSPPWQHGAVTGPTGEALEEIADAWCRYDARAAAGEKLWVDDRDWWAVEFWLAGSEVWANEGVV